MSASTVSTVRPGYGSRCTATVEPCAMCRLDDRAAAAHPLSDPQPHHDETTSCTPAAAISRIWARTTGTLELE